MKVSVQRRLNIVQEQRSSNLRYSFASSSVEVSHHLVADHVGKAPHFVFLGQVPVVCLGEGAPLGHLHVGPLQLPELLRHPPRPEHLHLLLQPGQEVVVHLVVWGHDSFQRLPCFRTYVTVLSLKLNCN